LLEKTAEKGHAALDILVCIDDTDNIESRGTGELASILSGDLENNGWGLCGPVTRHQMLIHPDIPYTSHNSSMCFNARISQESLETFTEHAQAFLLRESASGSDPGLCIVNCDRLADSIALMAFGKKAKTTVLAKEHAYELAEHLGIHLSEHGGNGLGVIGALAGSGLRLSGNDGRFRGHFQIAEPGERLKVADLLHRTGVDVVKSLDGRLLQEEEVVRIGKKVKAVLLDHQSTLLVFPESGDSLEDTSWRTCTKQQLRIY
jgi:hypothetical protein